MARIIASFLLSLFLICPGILKGQTYDELIANTLSGKDITDQLPPLATLQAQAEENSPLLKIHDANIVINQLKVNSEKREWMRSLGFEAGAKYGLFDNLILKEDLGTDEVISNTTEQTRYNIGIYLKIPISSIIDKSRVDLAVAERNRVHLQKEATVKELRQLVIVQYGNIVKAYRNIVILNNSVEVYRVQMVRAEKDFTNGKITVDEFARLNDMLSRTTANLEDTKVEYFVAIKLLEETVGVKIKIGG
jgi:outer membrane protein TolC